MKNVPSKYGPLHLSSCGWPNDIPHRLRVELDLYVHVREVGGKGDPRGLQFFRALFVFPVWRLIGPCRWVFLRAYKYELVLGLVCIGVSGLGGARGLLIEGFEYARFDE